MTREGQIKSFQRHEKDDRSSLNDRSRFILGWSTNHKTSALEEELEKVTEEGLSIASKIEEAGSMKNYCENQKEHAKALKAFNTFDSIDCKSIQEQLQQITQEKEERLLLNKKGQSAFPPFFPTLFLQKRQENFISQHQPGESHSQQDPAQNSLTPNPQHSQIADHSDESHLKFAEYPD